MTLVLYHYKSWLRKRTKALIHVQMEVMLLTS